MATLDQMVQFFSLTRDTQLTGVNDMRNEAARQSYLLGPMMLNHPDAVILRGGLAITDRVTLSRIGNFANYEPSQEENPQGANTVAMVRYQWRAGRNHIVFNEAQVELNTGDDLNSWKAFKRSIERDGHREHLEGLEDTMFTIPVDTMESGAPMSRTPSNSLMFFIAEDGSRHPALTSTLTIGGIDPTAQENWRNAFSAYTAGDLANRDTGIIAAFDDIDIKTQFVPPPGADSKEYQATNASKRIIVTNRDGLRRYQALLRGSNDNFVKTNLDPSYSGAQYHGSKLMYIQALDAAQLGGTAATPAVWADGSPRFLFIDTETLFPVWHTNHRMKQSKVISGGIKQPDTAAVFYDSWYQLCCTSRRRQGIVIPS